MLTKKSFYFIRHGQTDYNNRSICAGGKTDIPLNETGILQAKDLQKTLNVINYTNVFSSPMKRSIQTAKLATHISPEISSNLREWELGIFEGATTQIFFEHIKNLSLKQALPMGESKQAFIERSTKAINKILINHDCPLIFAHGGTYWAILQTLNIPGHHVENAKLIQFNYNNDWKLITFP